MRSSFFVLLCVVSLKAFGSCSLESKVQALIDSLDPYCDVGIEIQTMDGMPVLSRNSRHSYSTASTQKILSTVIALIASKEPSSFEGIAKNFGKKPFITSFYYDASFKKTYLVFGGDPLFKTKDLEFMIDQAKKKGLIGKEVVIILEKESSDSLHPFAPGIPYESLDFCYGVMRVPSIINENQISFQLSGKSPKSHAQITLNEMSSSFALQNETFVKDTCFEQEDVRNSEQIQRRAISFDGHKIRVKGCIPRTADFTMCIPVSLDHLPLYLKKLIQRALAKNGLSSSITFSFQKPKNLESLKHFDYSSSSLKKLLEISLKESNNLIADTLFEKVTQEKTLPRNWKFAGLVLKKYLQHFFDIEFIEGDEIESGSGLSIYNRLTPFTMTTLLRKIYSMFGEEFSCLLAEGGVDGTLKDRFKDLPFGRVLAKTGTLRGVSALAGYIYGKNKKPLVMTIIIMGASSKQKEHRQLIDAIVKETQGFFSVSS